MKRSKFTIIPDLCRTKLQRHKARLNDKHMFVPYPCSFPIPVEASTRSSCGEPWYRRAGIRSVLNRRLSSLFRSPEALRLLDKEDADICLMIQTGGVRDVVTHELLKKLALHYRYAILPERVGWREAAELASATDAGLASIIHHCWTIKQLGLSPRNYALFLFVRQAGGCQLAGELWVIDSWMRSPSSRRIRAFGAINAYDRIMRSIRKTRSDVAKNMFTLCINSMPFR